MFFAHHGESVRWRRCKSASRAKESDAGADRVRVVPCAEAVDRADPGHDEAASAGGESRRGECGADAG